MEERGASTQGLRDRDRTGQGQGWGQGWGQAALAACTGPGFGLVPGCFPGGTRAAGAGGGQGRRRAERWAQWEDGQHLLLVILGGKNNLLLAPCRFSSSPKAGVAQAALSPGFSTANATRHGGRRERAVPAGCSSLRPSQPAPLPLRILFFWAKSPRTWGIYSRREAVRQRLALPKAAGLRGARCGLGLRGAAVSIFPEQEQQAPRHQRHKNQASGRFRSFRPASHTCANPAPIPPQENNPPAQDFPDLGEGHLFLEPRGAAAWGKPGFDSPAPEPH